jgi:hypothetical protein
MTIPKPLFSSASCQQLFWTQIWSVTHFRTNGFEFPQGPATQSGVQEVPMVPTKLLAVTCMHEFLHTYENSFDLVELAISLLLG